MFKYKRLKITRYIILFIFFLKRHKKEDNPYTYISLRQYAICICNMNSLRLGNKQQQMKKQMSVPGSLRHCLELIFFV